MDQQKIGAFLKSLRKAKGVTQEQLAQELGVSNRSVSRWENGATMPDFDLLILIAKYYDMGIEEILDGERKDADMDKKTEETLYKVADYNNGEKLVLSKRFNRLFILGTAALLFYTVCETQGLTEYALWDKIASVMLGIAFGVLMGGILYTSRYMGKIKAFKRKLLHRDKQL